MKKALILLAGAIIGGYVIKEQLPRGIRNNNPGNIRMSGADWRGKIPHEQNTDGSFEQFESMKYGVRALCITLLTYESKYGINTVEGIINRWAPSSENNTQAYISHVCEALNVAKNQPFSVAMRLDELASVIIEHENGGYFAWMIPVESGVKMALDDRGYKVA